ncbi:hypothetical protein AURDEDRAFT_73048 [Auricularia subglabra TFB-10046 SS5]|uniref:Protein kinase domain-containing protein n=1 Tax=Auricularia subglabra (strain TFB-10046 / SS5) TaxID=717982 RepID=J0DAZ6_AURST|nr:hypothetical protein AURDEDRAFT_73048 [Auricularia subglabra TFB-10046 SS5]
MTRGGPFALTEQELFWRDVQPFLLDRGYSLRPRYAPDWKPSWAGTNINPRFCEDGAITVPTWVMDARRADGTAVAIKWIPDALHTANELDIMRYLSSDELQADPRCHTLPLLDTFSHPTIPMADIRGMARCSPCPVAETLKGLFFLHVHGVAHRSTFSPSFCATSSLNDAIAIAQLVASWWTSTRCCQASDGIRRIRCTPWSTSRARYYLIDMGISSRFNSDSPGPHLVVGTVGRDQTAPELSDTVPYDPFKLDVYLLGNYFLTRFIAEHENLQFLKPVVDAMTHPTPAERPTIDAAYEQLCGILRKQSGRAFRWRLRGYDEPRGFRLAMGTFCFVRELYYWARVPLRGTRELRFGRPPRCQHLRTSL